MYSILGSISKFFCALCCTILYIIVTIIIGIQITIHPGRHEGAPFQILDILELEGGDISHVCITHNDRTFNDITKLQELAGRNCYINISLFGKECSHYQYDLDVDMPSDAHRIDMINRLLQSGHKEKILISHDVVCNKHMEVMDIDIYWRMWYPK